MKKEYKQPSVVIITLNQEDIITLSGIDKKQSPVSIEKSLIDF